MQTRSGILKGGLAGGALSLLGCLGILAVVALCVGGLFFLITGSFRSSDVYQEALTAAQNDPEVQAELGAPIEAGWFVMGSMETAGLSGTADLRIPIHGPDGSGMLFASARRENGVWRFYTLAVQVDGQDSLIVLDN